MNPAADSIRHSPAVAAALRTAFGTAPVRWVGPVTGGLSGAGLFRLEADGGPWLLRIEGARDMFRDPARGHACMQVAAAAGVAPAVRYADSRSGVSIMAFVEGQTLAEGYDGCRAAMIGTAGALLQRLHAAPPFPPLVDYMDGMAALIANLRATGLCQESAVGARLTGYDLLDEAYRRLEPDPVSSHNDLNPRNILYDGTRLWLVDWESSFLADRYVDLAGLANSLTLNSAELAVLTEAYFGRKPTGAEGARLFLARQVNHVFYGVMFLAGVAAERPAARIEASHVAPDLTQVHTALSQGRFSLESWDGRLIYGLARLEAARSTLASPLFAEAVRLAR